MAWLKRLVKEESGQGMVEYGLIIALIAIAVVAGLRTLGGEISTLFGNIQGELTE
ncbi:MAG: Flp family type IVb pilin [bacterium]|jgi:pilus assembly protein Flp/PilA